MSDPVKVLVTGGVRSGKSRHAEELVAGEPMVTYLAPGPTADDPDWADRIDRHRERRPDHWETVETSELARGLATPGAVLVDCLGTWLTAIIDRAEAWEAPSGELEAVVAGELDAAVEALRARADTTVLVTNEVGMGIHPEHRSGRLFRDLLGTVNQRIGSAVAEVHLVVAGRVLRL